MLRSLSIDSFHHGSFSSFAARAALPAENWRSWKSPAKSAVVGDDDRLFDEKSLKRRLGAGDVGNLAMACRNEGFRKWV